MAHFTIELADGRHADVRRGRVVREIRGLRTLFKRHLASAKRIGYIVQIDPPVEGQKAYRLFKSMDGVWLADEMPGINHHKADPAYILVQEAIDRYEKLSS